MAKKKAIPELVKYKTPDGTIECDNNDCLKALVKEKFGIVPKDLKDLRREIIKEEIEIDDDVTETNIDIDTIT